MKKALVFILCYNAERHIEKVLDRIPRSLWQNTEYTTEIILIDDHSKDNTFSVAQNYLARENIPIKVMRTPFNQGYGGNQKLGYTYAIEKGFDAVVMLHGDGQYAPEYLPALLEPILRDLAQVVFGSRMMQAGDAIKGGMPRYKYVSNRILTLVQNWILHLRLSEFHSGYRAYAISALKRIPFNCNSDWFDFDTDIIIQLADQKIPIHEIPIPTHYGDEICHVNNIRYGLSILKACLQSRLMRLSIFYHRKFDYDAWHVYEDKTTFDSSHGFAIDHVSSSSRVVDIGCSSGHIARQLKSKQCHVYGIDNYTPSDLSPFDKFTEHDINKGLKDIPMTEYDAILLLDVIEHLDNPEAFMDGLYDLLKITQTRVILTTPNIAFIIMRLMLMIGRFEYGKRGILDKTHKRLFTFASLRRLLTQSGFIISHTEGIPAPFPLAFGDNIWANILLKLNRGLIKISKGLFSFQIGMVLIPKRSFEKIYEDTLASGEIKPL